MHIIEYKQEIYIYKYNDNLFYLNELIKKNDTLLINFIQSFLFAHTRKYYQVQNIKHKEQYCSTHYRFAYPAISNLKTYFGKRNSNCNKSVSYTHLTLPTICSVQILDVGVSIKKKNIMHNE
eukprot:TRINITY_DN12099_c0_g1_i1.p1 TRINITY_DN12099_c0_g1~~TRINITY_DN12099_c0_g1_i1.p1  ORF type:complete len:122 (+),score=16.35 TRINITY_DN12099_c0_g1_i1:27-392(+)